MAKNDKNKRELFMETTLNLIYEKGFHATSVRDIATNANFKVANVYNYVDSKEAFLEEYLFAILNDFTQYLDHILESTYSPEEKLKFVINRHVQFTIKEPYQVALFVHDYRNLKEPKLAQFKEGKKQYLSKVGSIIAEGIKAGQFRSVDIKIGTFLVFSSLRWLFNILIHDEESINPIQLEKQISDYVFGGIGLK